MRNFSKRYKELTNKTIAGCVTWLFRAKMKDYVNKLLQIKNIEKKSLLNKKGFRKIEKMSLKCKEAESGKET